MPSGKSARTRPDMELRQKKPASGELNMDLPPSPAMPTLAAEFSLTNVRNRNPKCEVDQVLYHNHFPNYTRHLFGAIGNERALNWCHQIDVESPNLFQDMGLYITVRVQPVVPCVNLQYRPAVQLFVLQDFLVLETGE